MTEEQIEKAMEIWRKEYSLQFGREIPSQREAEAKIMISAILKYSNGRH